MKRIKKVVSMILIIAMAIQLNVYAEGEEFTVTYNLTNVTANGGISTVTSGSPINASITADEGYELPDTTEVNGAFDEFTYEQNTGEIEITNMQSDIEIVADGVEIITETEIGTIVLRFLDEEGNELLPEDTLSEMGLGKYTFNAPTIEGYTADFDSETVSLTTDEEVIEVIFTYTMYPESQAQIRVVLADCSDIQNLEEDDALEAFIQRSMNEEHNVLEERYFNLVIGENLIDIPFEYGNLEWQFTGSFWDSRFDREKIEDKQGNSIGVKVNAPYLEDLDLYIGYIEPEEEIIEEPIEEPSIPDSTPSKSNSKPTTVIKEKQIISIMDIKQEDFIARYIDHKLLTDELKKSTEEKLQFEVDKTLLNELLEDGLTPRIYRWNEEKGKLIAEDTKIEIKQGTDNIYTLTSSGNPYTNSYLGKENYYTLIAVKQPSFVDMDYNVHIDKANGLGIIEGIEKDGRIYFEADKTISKSEFYTMVARMFGAVPKGETKMYDILDLKTMEEAIEILQGLDLCIADWSKPYVASLYEKRYITEQDTNINGDKFTSSMGARLLEKLLSEVEDVNSDTARIALWNFEQGKDVLSGLETDKPYTRYYVVSSLAEILGKFDW